MKNMKTLAAMAVSGTAVAGGLTACREQARPERYNIIHIMTDDHAWQAISAYGHPLSRLAPTPNIDRIARAGILFRQGCVENSLSAPSRAALLTGLYSHKNGQQTLSKGFREDNVVFPQLLREAGYQTAVVGKWHLDVEPYGFDYYKILHNQGEYYNPEFMSPETHGEYVAEEGYATTLITDHALEWLDGRDPGRPFALLLHHKAPHRNWMPEEKYFDLYEETEFPFPETFDDDFATRGPAAASAEMGIERFMTLRYDLKVNGIACEPNAAQESWSQHEWHAAYDRMTEAQRQAWDAAYASRNEEFLAANLSGEALRRWKYQCYIRDYMRCIKSVDDQVGRLLDYLEAHGLTENTLVVYTSDQGFYMGEHGWFDKRFAYSESMRTPIVAMCPGVIPAGTVSDALVQNIDFAPTYLDFAGVRTSVPFDGVSFRPVTDGSVPDDWRKDVYYHYYDYPAIHMVRKHDGVYDGRYKLVHFYGDGAEKDAGNRADYYEFYDLKNDPCEVHNLYGTDGCQPEIDRLMERLRCYRAENAVAEY